MVNVKKVIEMYGDLDYEDLFNNTKEDTIAIHLHTDCSLNLWFEKHEDEALMYTKILCPVGACGIQIPISNNGYYGIKAFKCESPEDIRKAYYEVICSTVMRIQHDTLLLAEKVLNQIYDTVCDYRTINSVSKIKKFFTDVEELSQRMTYSYTLKIAIPDNPYSVIKFEIPSCEDMDVLDIYENDDIKITSSNISNFNRSFKNIELISKNNDKHRYTITYQILRPRSAAEIISASNEMEKCITRILKEDAYAEFIRAKNTVMGMIAHFGLDVGYVETFLNTIGDVAKHGVCGEYEIVYGEEDDEADEIYGSDSEEK